MEKQAAHGYIKDQVCIEYRPDITDECTRIGDWDIHLIIGKDHSGALLTVVERLARYTVTKRIFD
ncbi:MAG: hypothetical protein KAH18_02160 [Psychromonas sp.]|nr:hypothetical protein [Psychromonas sp.]